MSFTIPSAAAAAFADQSEPDPIDFEVLAAGSGLTGVVSGCAVTAQGSPDLTVAVASGTIMSSGVLKLVSSGNVTIATPDATNPRFDLIVVDSTGTKQRRAGTASANPVFPTPTAGDVVLAAVYVPANDTTIDPNQIVDKRVMLVSPGRPATADITASETTTSSTYADIGGGGPAVTLLTAETALVIVEAIMWSGTAGSAIWMSFGVSGATSRSALDVDAAETASTNTLALSRQTLLTGLTPGSNTFTAKYRADSGATGNYMNRRIVVVPL